MYRFIISIILLICTTAMDAQLFKDLEPGRLRFVRISVDPTVPLKSYKQNADITGFEATIDTEIKQNLFVSGGFGSTSTNQAIERLEYSNTGMFFNIGANLNLTKYQNPRDRDIFFFGLHYGYANFTHKAPLIKMTNEWGTSTRSIGDEKLTASWVEIAMGVKTELAKNLFIGWTGEAKILSHLSASEIPPYNIPGFGKNDSAISFDLNLYISYAISFKGKSQPLPSDNTLD